MATTRSGDRYSAIRAPRSCRILLRRDPIFELVKHRRQRSNMRPSILTIHRTVTTRRADFAVRLTRRDRRAPSMMLELAPRGPPRRPPGPGLAGRGVAMGQWVTIPSRPAVLAQKLLANSAGSCITRRPLITLSLQTRQRCLWGPLPNRGFELWVPER